MKRISNKKAKQFAEERKLKCIMIAKADGDVYHRRAKCAMCGQYGLVDKHEIIPRSLGGDPLDEANCVLLCRLHHQAEKDPALRHRDREDFPFRGPL